MIMCTVDRWMDQVCFTLSLMQPCHFAILAGLPRRLIPTSRCSPTRLAELFKYILRHWLVNAFIVLDGSSIIMRRSIVQQKQVPYVGERSHECDSGHCSATHFSFFFEGTCSTLFIPDPTSLGLVGLTSFGFSFGFCAFFVNFPDLDFGTFPFCFVGAGAGLGDSAFSVEWLFSVARSSDSRLPLRLRARRQRIDNCSERHRCANSMRAASTHKSRTYHERGVCVA